MQTQILGDDIQTLLITLDPRESIMTETAAVFMQTPNIEMDTGAKDGLWKSIKRTLVGEDLFLSLFSNKTSTVGQVGLSSPKIGKILTLSLAEHKSELIVQKGAFLAGSPDTNIDIKFQKKISAGLFGGEGFILQSLKGNGEVFLQTSGGLIEKKLLPGESILTETSGLVAMTSEIDFSVEAIGGAKNLLFAKEGLFRTRLTGPGTVWIQTLPFKKIAHSVYKANKSLRKRDARNLAKKSSR